MALVTRAELEARFSPGEIAGLADRDGDTAEDSGAVDAAITDAEAEVLAYVTRVAPVLPDPAPDVLRRIAAIVARYNLWRRDTGPDHPAYVAYRDAVRELRDIADGRITLPDATTGADTATAAAGAVYAPVKHFTDDAMARMLPQVWP